MGMCECYLFEQGCEHLALSSNVVDLVLHVLVLVEGMVVLVQCSLGKRVNVAHLCSRAGME